MPFKWSLSLDLVDFYEAIDQPRLATLASTIPVETSAPPFKELIDQDVYSHHARLGNSFSESCSVYSIQGTV